MMNAVFVVGLSAAATTTSTVSWATRDGSAIAGIDYVGASGTVTFQPGETTKMVTINTIDTNTTDVKWFGVVITAGVGISASETFSRVIIVPKAQLAVGPAGTNGKSAYEIAQINGYSGTQQQWLASLVGPSGGVPGTNGTNGTNGAAGKSAYEVAVQNGYVGTSSQWLASLKGSTGAAGVSNRATVVQAPTVTGSYNCDMASGSTFILGLTSSVCTIGITGLNVIANTSQEITIVLKQGTGNNLVQWPSNITWSKSTSPILSITAGYFDVVKLFSYDGVNWNGYLANSSNSTSSNSTNSVQIGNGFTIVGTN